MHPPSRTQSVPLFLSSPPAARTADSIALVWNKPAGGVGRYEVFTNGVLAAVTSSTDCTLRSLAAGETYAVQVRAYQAAESWLQSEVLPVATLPQPRVFEITAYGAVGDGQTLTTRAIQAAIDACCPGGLVRIPAGVFLSGALFLKGEMTLYLEEGAVLLGSPEPRDYPLVQYRWEGRERLCYASLINTRVAGTQRLRNLTLAGRGTINANGSALRKKELSEAAGAPGRAVCIRNTDNLYLQDLTVRQSPAWCVHLVYCSAVSVNGVKIHTRYDEQGNHYPGIANGDGLNPDSCHDVAIFNCQIASQDDCIALKSGRDAEGRAVGIPTQNVRISNCRFTSGFGVAIGSEMSGGVRNVLVEDCVFQNTFSMISLKAPRGRGGVIENVTVRDCTLTNHAPDLHDCEWFRGALNVDQFYASVEFDPHQAQSRDEGTPKIRNIRFGNLALETVGGHAIYLTGLPESPLEDIRLQNITATGKHGLVANNVRGLVLDKVSVEAREGRAMRFANVQTERALEQ